MNLRRNLKRLRQIRKTIRDINYQIEVMMEQLDNVPDGPAKEFTQTYLKHSIIEQYSEINTLEREKEDIIEPLRFYIVCGIGLTFLILILLK